MLKNCSSLLLALALQATWLGPTHAADDWYTLPPATPSPANQPLANQPSASIPPADNPPPDPSGAAILTDLKQREQFFKIAPAYFRAFIRWGDDYAVLPAYNPAFPNNVGYTVDQAQIALGKPGTEFVGAVTKKVISPLPLPETQAIVMPIQDIKPGHYGYIHSFKVDKVLSADEMTVSDIWIMDLPAMSKEMADAWVPMERKARAQGNINENLKRSIAAKNQAILNTVIVNADGSTTHPQIDEAYTAKINALPETQDLVKLARAELDNMYLHRVRLAKSQQSGRFTGPFKVNGYLTSGIIEGTRWYGSNAIGVVGQGFQIAVIRPYGSKPSTAPAPPPQAKNPEPRNPPAAPILIIPAQSFKKSLTAEQFAVMLAKYGITPDEFVDMAVKEMRHNPKTARERIFINLENLRENWEARLNAPTPPAPPENFIQRR